MDGTFIPIFLAILGLIAGLIANRTIRRGSARFYALEREALLRRASFFTLAAVVLFATSVGLMAYNTQQSRQIETDQQTLNDSAATAAANTQSNIVIVTTTPVVQNQPDTPVPTETIDPNLPTPTPTPIIRRAYVENTGGAGAYLRDRAGTDGEELEILREQTIVTLLDDVQPVDANGFNWIKVRTVAGEEGWVADFYLTISNR